MLAQQQADGMMTATDVACAAHISCARLCMNMGGTRRCFLSSGRGLGAVPRSAIMYCCTQPKHAFTVSLALVAALSCCWYAEGVPATATCIASQLIELLAIHYCECIPHSSHHIYKGFLHMEKKHDCTYLIHPSY